MPGPDEAGDAGPDQAENQYNSATDTGDAMDPFTTQEETFLKTVQPVRRFINVRTYHDASYTLTDQQFHNALLDPRVLQFARAITVTPGGVADIHGRAVR
jgi:hypothetical protein